MNGWEWLRANQEMILRHLLDHVQITCAALLLGVAVALPLGVVCHRWAFLYPLLRAATQVVYTIPALALFVILVQLVGLGQAPVILALAMYSLVILVVAVVTGLRAVPNDVVEAATAMGYRPMSRLVRVELPMALPTLVAGMRAATVSTISLVSLGALIGTGGLGQLFIHGFQVDNPTEILAGLAGTFVLALVGDLLLVAAGREATPWLEVAR